MAELIAKVNQPFMAKKSKEQQNNKQEKEPNIMQIPKFPRGVFIPSPPKCSLSLPLLPFQPVGCDGEGDKEKGYPAPSLEERWDVTDPTEGFVPVGQTCSIGGVS